VSKEDYLTGVSEGDTTLVITFNFDDGKVRNGVGGSDSFGRVP